ncbi:trichohyalin isoform X3 [Denticeps clupeoides]|uniref:trichohyalin isoform X3 n=1 Tax=Denticeps clupeoides TaxID=299321 RepID=UPI0010A50FA0|nr:trichohyalin-like isoform X3 [Denticeps clupeoides]
MADQPERSGDGSDAEPPAETDRFGFILRNGHSDREGPSPVEVRHRENKWLSIISQWEDVSHRRSSKVKVQCQKGIPASLRAKCWPLLCGALCRMQQSPAHFQALDESPALQSWVDAIERDTDRQFPFHEMFLSRDGPGQRGLFRVLKAYTLFRPDEGYCQAQGPVAGVLLMNMPTEEAFWCLVQISEFYLPGYYSPLLEGVLFDAAMLSWVLKRTCPAAHRHLRKQGVEPLMFATDWLMCLYTRHLPFNTLLRVWDLFFCYGVRVLFQVAVVLVRRVLGRGGQRHECEGQVETLERLRGVKESVQHEEADAFIQEVCAIPLSEKDLQRRTTRELEKWRKERPNSTFNPQERCHGYLTVWERIKVQEEKKEREEKERGHLSLPLLRSPSSLSPSLLRKKWKKRGSRSVMEEHEGSTGDEKEGRRLNQQGKEDRNSTISRGIDVVQKTSVASVPQIHIVMEEESTKERSQSKADALRTSQPGPLQRQKSDQAEGKHETEEETLIGQQKDEEHKNKGQQEVTKQDVFNQMQNDQQEVIYQTQIDQQEVINETQKGQQEEINERHNDQQEAINQIKKDQQEVGDHMYKHQEEVINQQEVSDQMQNEQAISSQMKKDQQEVINEMQMDQQEVIHEMQKDQQEGINERQNDTQEAINQIQKDQQEVSDLTQKDHQEVINQKQKDQQEATNQMQNEQESSQMKKDQHEVIKMTQKGQQDVKHQAYKHQQEAINQTQKDQKEVSKLTQKDHQEVINQEQNDQQDAEKNQQEERIHIQTDYREADDTQNSKQETEEQLYEDTDELHGLQHSDQQEETNQSQQGGEMLKTQQEVEKQTQEPGNQGEELTCEEQKRDLTQTDEKRDAQIRMDQEDMRITDERQQKTSRMSTQAETQTNQTGAIQTVSEEQPDSEPQTQTEEPHSEVLAPSPSNTPSPTHFKPHTLNPTPQIGSPKRLGLFSILRGGAKSGRGHKTQPVPKILIQDFSEEKVQEKVTSRERRRRRREQERRQKEEEKQRRKQEKELQGGGGEKERRKPQTRGRSFQVQGSQGRATDNPAHNSQTWVTRRNSAPFSENYF